MDDETRMDFEAKMLVIDLGDGRLVSVQMHPDAAGCLSIATGRAVDGATPSAGFVVRPGAVNSLHLLVDKNT
jgi:hypothetical protein